MMRRAAHGPAVLLTLLFLLVTAPLLGDFGPTWDCAVGEYPHGEQYLARILTSDPAYLDFPPPARLPDFREPHLDYAAVDWFTWPQSYPFAALLSALSCRVLWTGVGLVPSLQAHNLVVLLFAAALLYVLVVFAVRRGGAVAAVGTALALFLSPRFLAHSFNNLKDIPEAALYVGALLAAAVALQGGRLRWFVLTGLVTGLALAQKPNALFLPVHGLLLWLGWNAIRLARRRQLLRVPWLGLLVAIPVFAGAYLLVSPMLWADPGRRFLEHLAFIISVGQNSARADALDGVKHVVWTTPPVILALAAAGPFSRRMDADTRWFLLLGVLVPIGRTALPGMANFDGVRHFIEYHAFLAVLAGFGLAAAVDVARALVRRGRTSGAVRGAVAVVVAVAAACYASPLAQVVTTYPNGICYFNRFIGGLAGAQSIGLHEATDYWCNSYWQGLAWISGHARDGAAVLVPLAEHVAAVAAPLRLRDGVTLADPYAPAPPAELYVMFVTRKSWPEYDGLPRQLAKNHAPVHRILVQGGTILLIFRFTEQAVIERLQDDWFDWRAFQRVGLWLHAQRRDAEILLRQAPRFGVEKTLELLEPILPQDVRRDAPRAVRYAAEHLAAPRISGS